MQRQGCLARLRKLEVLTEDEVARTALHPRLQQPMRLLDWAYFVAEHDDHHLALARQAILHAARSTAVAGSAVGETGEKIQPTTNGIPTDRELFEIPDGVTYLNCANMAPQLRSITAAGINAVRAKAIPWTFRPLSGSREPKSCAVWRRK